MLENINTPNMLSYNHLGELLYWIIFRPMLIFLNVMVSLWQRFYFVSSTVICASAKRLL